MLKERKKYNLVRILALIIKMKSSILPNNFLTINDINSFPIFNKTPQ